MLTYSLLRDDKDYSYDYDKFMAAKRECTCIFMHISWPFHMHSNISMLFTMSTAINISCCKERIHQLHSSEVSVKSWAPLITSHLACRPCLARPAASLNRTILRAEFVIGLRLISVYFTRTSKCRPAALLTCPVCEANLLRDLRIFDLQLQIDV